MNNSEKAKIIKELAKLEEDIRKVGQKYRDAGVINDDRLRAFQRAARTLMAMIESQVLV